MMWISLYYKKGVDYLKDWCLEVWGDYACFTRPEMKVERVSYDVITPSAARAIFESILWKPAIKWNITKIEILNPIKWISVRRNEVGKVIPTPTAKQMEGVLKSPMGIFIEDSRQQRAGLFLKNVRYRIYGYFDMKSDEEAGKYAAMFQRRASQGQCYHRPYLGCREFACDFRLVDGPENETVQPLDITQDLGYMLYDMDFEMNPNNPPALFYKAQIKNGVIDTDARRVEVRG